MRRAFLALLAFSLAACGREATTALESRLTTDRGPSAEGLRVPGWNEVRCFDAAARRKRDPDGDTMDNACEDALAAAFAPGLKVAVDCNYDPGVGRQGGEYYYGVQPYWHPSSAASASPTCPPITGRIAARPRKAMCPSATGTTAIRSSSSSTCSSTTPPGAGPPSRSSSLRTAVR